jgi:hypothetical protein
MKLTKAVLTIAITLAATCAVAQTNAQKTFDTLKTLSGSWQGKTSSGKAADVDFRVTSGGSALMSEIKGDEDMITMMHLDGDRLLMTHYCGAGNQPRFTASLSPDGRSVDFKYLDATNLSTQPGHMQHVVFTLADANHHSEDWTFVAPDGKQMHEHFELERKN